MWAFWRGFSSSYSETCQCRKQGTFSLLSAVSDLQPKASWLEFSWEGSLQTGVVETAPESCLQIINNKLIHFETDWFAETDLFAETDWFAQVLSSGSEFCDEKKYVM